MAWIQNRELELETSSRFKVNYTSGFRGICIGLLQKIMCRAKVKGQSWSTIRCGVNWCSLGAATLHQSERLSSGPHKKHIGLLIEQGVQGAY